MGGRREKCSTLVILSALVAVELARRLDPEQLELLSAFFEVLGDDLALLAVCPPHAEAEPL